MGRPPLHMSSMNLRLPEDLKRRIDALVGEKHRAQFIREAIERALEKQEKKPRPSKLESP
ncbi:MAG: hypothetical protein E5X49_05170 [Mesorhizobium sp.]|uniref:ribbon-helix-helix domain-containing protein n=1 Tax=Mesorhizobium sp. TaxID=1871066 RepID=UPI000FE325C9|nr:ribbon-helix-helix domain-containing protein [Mesorhizobium sp.]RWA73838.1 MAG: hypothetical protein EOQ28_12495 [Mesorhizobium sp.]RWC05358.1 MAG: hypothetical protein EOQ57_03085 [Mesorhizobium sp.]RWG86783.1 MAG: hypothetical protein EOQ69_05355 [Mesorhizobium sp.]RWG90393.1 MAG: hypothetical protein EOQ70_04255 [Mesorhizobium sp.]RWK09473.1 MAG: hypothetical protein EOR42_01815 [Mesorhizobium sp.]